MTDRKVLENGYQGVSGLFGAPAAASGVTALSSPTAMEPASGLHPNGLQSAGAAVVETGWLKGHPIRTARKAGKCAEYRQCGNMIAAGDRYVEGEVDPYKAGGFGYDRLCLKCGGEQ